MFSRTRVAPEQRRRSQWYKSVYTMRQSHLFTKTRKEAPKDEVSHNAKLLIRAGYVHKEMAGVYSFLPLGVRVLNRIQNIIRQEMNSLGATELFLTSLQDKSTWEQTNRWSDVVVDVWFKTKLKNDTEVGLAFTHEDPITALMREHVQSYRDLPVQAYQFQTKFRNETRAKSGIMRSREFIMKDMYSFSRDQVEHDVFYEKAKNAYMQVFQRVGLGKHTFVTFASGGSFSKFSHEFQTITDAGEDTIYLDEEKGMAVNEEVMQDDVLESLGLVRSKLVQKKSIEVGNIFGLGTRFSEPLGLTFLDEKGEKKTVIMGSYGIGPARLMGTVVELFADAAGIVWPESSAPFGRHLILMAGKDDTAKARAEQMYTTLTKAGVEVLYDERDARAGEKFADSDLIGIPHRAVVSEKALAAGTFELKNRATGAVEQVTEEELIARFTKAAAERRTQQ